MNSNRNKQDPKFRAAVNDFTRDDNSTYEMIVDINRQLNERSEAIDKLAADLDEINSVLSSIRHSKTD